jgi:hypothetical protein
LEDILKVTTDDKELEILGTPAIDDEIVNL